MTKIMVNFKNVAVALVLMLTCFFAFTACGGVKPFADNPDTNDEVNGNGSLAVTKGNYVYYTNGFVGYSNVKDTNKEGNITYAGLYRTKLIDGKVVENEEEKDEDGNVIFDKTQGIQNTELLVSKVCGFEYMGLYIFGDYIYYTTPNNQKGGDLVVRTDLIDFCRTKLDRSSGQEVLYTTTNIGSKVTSSMYQDGNNVYLIIQDGSTDTDTSKVVVKSITKNSIATFTTSSEWKITSIAKTNYTSSKDIVNSFDKNFYFTYQTADISDYTVLAKLELGTNNVTPVLNDNDSIISLITSKGGKLYYTRNTVTLPKANAYLYNNDLSKNDIIESERQLTNVAYSSYYVLGDGLGEGFLAYNSTDKTLLKKIGNNAISTVMTDATIDNVIGIYGNYIYYVSSSNIYKFDFVNEGSAVSLTSADGTISAGSANYVSVIGNKMFYLKEYSNGTNTAYYLHIKNFDYIDADTSIAYDHFIGALAEVDYLVESAE